MVPKPCLFFIYEYSKYHRQRKDAEKDSASLTSKKGKPASCF